MMTVRLRLGAMLARWALFERKKPPEATSRLRMRAWLFDCDFNRHVNNARYLSFMDLGRWHYLLTSGMGRAAFQRGWLPVAARVEIDYKRSIKPGEVFELETWVMSVGTKSAVVAQRFRVGEAIAADARVVVLFRSKEGSQPLVELLAELPHVAEKLEARELAATP